MESWVEDCGLFHGWPKEAVTYFDRDAYECDCRYDFTVVNAPRRRLCLPRLLIQDALTSGLNWAQARPTSNHGCAPG